MPRRSRRPLVGSGTAAKETAQQPLNADSFFGYGSNSLSIPLRIVNCGIILVVRRQLHVLYA